MNAERERMTVRSGGWDYDCIEASNNEYRKTDRMQLRPWEGREGVKCYKQLTCSLAWSSNRDSCV